MPNTCTVCALLALPARTRSQLSCMSWKICHAGIPIHVSKSILSLLQQPIATNVAAIASSGGEIGGGGL